MIDRGFWEDGKIGSTRNLSPYLYNNLTSRNLSYGTILELWSQLKAYNFQGKAWTSKLRLILVKINS